jgi:propionyl-CoA carboxylase beta chain
MVKEKSHMFITGPDVIKTVTKEEVSKELLGGADTHTSISGVAHFEASDDEACIAMCKELLSYLPQNNLDSAPMVFSGDLALREDPSLDRLIPDQPNQPYDIKELITSIGDSNQFFEVQGAYAPNIVIGFIRLNGHSTGIVANQPSVLAGCLDINASTKAARFVRFCDAFNIPITRIVVAYSRQLNLRNRFSICNIEGRGRAVSSYLTSSSHPTTQPQETVPPSPFFSPTNGP